MARREPDERPAGMRVRIRGPLPRQVREEQHAVAARRHAERLVDERRERHTGSERVAEPLEAPRGRQHHAHDVPPVRHRVAERVQPALRIDQRFVGRGEHDPRCAERERHHAGLDRSHADRRRRLIASARHHRRARPQTGRVRGLGRDRPGDRRSLVRRAVTTPSRCPARPRPRSDQSRAARSNSSVPAPSARSTAWSPVSLSRTRSFGSRMCAICDQTSGSWRRTHMSLGAVNPASASLPVTAIRRSRPIVSRISSHSASVRWSFHRIAGRRTSSCRSSATRPCICPASPTASTSSPATPDAASAAADRGDRSVPPELRILFAPQRLRRLERVLGGRCGVDGAFGVEQHGLGRGGRDVEPQDVAHRSSSAGRTIQRSRWAATPSGGTSRSGPSVSSSQNSSLRNTWIAAPRSA